MPVDALKAECRRFGATVGEYLTAAIAYGVYEIHGLQRRKRPVSIFVPVNLRPIFGTETSLNFFSNLTIILPLARRAVPFEDVMEAVKRQFAEKLTREEFEQKLAFTAGSEKKNLITRIIPLPLKNGILRIVYEHSNNGSTLVFSNLGPVRVEEPFRRYFEGLPLSALHHAQGAGEGHGLRLRQHAGAHLHHRGGGQPPCAQRGAQACKGGRARHAGDRRRYG